jgi:putative radical SAM enzyme (TIGR03279 family)
MVKISGVEKKSLAEKAGILAGDKLLAISDNEICDVLDYRFYITEKKLSLKIERDGEILTFDIKKPQYDDIGLEFETYLMDEKHTCTNKCVFCFIDQNPEGMRPMCYFKDDDSRMSFFYGNYVTLTNMKEAEVDRLIKMRISPINISVHTTNPDLRCKMLNNRFAGDVLRYMDKFKEGGISMNCQIVLCKGLNDGKELERTLDDLAKLFPSVESIAVVPSGLTKYREGLYPLEDFTKEDAREVIRLVNAKRKEFEAKTGHTIVQCSDEWYLKAGIELPDEDYYDGYPQLDNGVGLIKSMESEVLMRIEELKEEGFKLDEPRCVSSVTGEAAYPFISRMAKKLMETFEGLTFNVYECKNEFFGHTVNVAGLLVGEDLYNRLKDENLGEELLIPHVMLRHEGDLFLDNMDVDDLAEKLGTTIYPIPASDGFCFVDAVLGN